MALRGEVRGDRIGDLDEGQPVDPGADEGGKLGVVVDLGGRAGAVLPAMIGDRRIGRGQGFNTLLNAVFKGT
ncbi:hypothetical protein RNZ50_18670 [Paracoccaceae bacterium Fryx2]|nr:hypothetical protein [Paracoccaceae bacterium Fryx2]